jgi:hypothetical protein
MDYSFVDDPPIAQVLYDDALQQRRSDSTVPHPLRIHDHNRPTAADAEAGSFAALDTVGAKEQSFPLEQQREQRVQRATAAVGRAKTTCAHQHVSRIGLHGADEVGIGVTAHGKIRARSPHGS